MIRLMLALVMFGIVTPAWADTAWVSERTGLTIMDIDFEAINQMCLAEYQRRDHRYKYLPGHRYDVELWGIPVAAVVVDVRRGSPAARMNVKKGDIIAAFLYYPFHSSTIHISFLPNGRPDRRVDQSDYEYLLDFRKKWEPRGGLSAKEMAEVLDSLTSGHYLRFQVFTGYRNGKLLIYTAELDDPEERTLNQNRQYADQIERDNIRRNGELSRSLQQQFNQWQSEMKDLSRP